MKRKLINTHYKSPKWNSLNPTKLYANNETALMIAARQSLPEICKILIAGMTPKSICAVNPEGENALMIASSQGLTAICSELITKMSTEAICAVNINKDTVLITAAGYGFPVICHMLINAMTSKFIDAASLTRYNALINATNSSGYTALMLAADNKLADVCETLISSMSSDAINIANIDGETALMIAADRGLTSVCKTLITRMSFEAINAVNVHGNTALTFAEMAGCNHICKILADHMSCEAVESIVELNKIKKNTLNLMIENAQLESDSNLAIKLMFRMSEDIVSKTVTCTHYKEKSLAKAKAQGLANFIRDIFKDSADVKVDYSDFNKFKLYQLIHPKLFESCLNSPEEATKLASKTNSYITQNYFTITCCTKQSLNLFALLPQDCLALIFSFLGPQNLFAVQDWKYTDIEINAVKPSGLLANDEA